MSLYTITIGQQQKNGANSTLENLIKIGTNWALMLPIGSATDLYVHAGILKKKKML